MHATHPHPRRALVAAAAVLALLALLALAPAALQDASFSIGERSAPTEVSAPGSAQAEPAWSQNPFAYPLLQAPAQSIPAGS